MDAVSPVCCCRPTSTVQYPSRSHGHSNAAEPCARASGVQRVQRWRVLAAAGALRRCALCCCLDVWIWILETVGERRVGILDPFWILGQRPLGRQQRLCRTEASGLGSRLLQRVQRSLDPRCCCCRALMMLLSGCRCTVDIRRKRYGRRLAVGRLNGNCTEVLRQWRATYRAAGREY